MNEITSITQPRVVFLGVSADAEFAEARLQLLSRLPAGIVGNCPTISEFASQAETLAPELIVVWQRWPEEFPTEQVWQFLALVPLARVVCVYGPWCESDGRTRQHWPPGLRVPVWQAVRRIEQELQALRSEGPPPLPWTASREEVWLRDVALSPLPDLSQTRIALLIPDRELAQTLREALQAAGAVIVDERDSAEILLVDIEPWTAERQGWLTSLLAEAGEQPVIGFSAWITAEIRCECLEIGLAAVVPKLDPQAIIEAVAELS